MKGHSTRQGAVPCFIAQHHRTHNDVSLKFKMEYTMADSSSTVRLYRSVKQDQDIPIRIRLCISPSARPIEDNPCSWLDIVDCLADAIQQGSVMVSRDVLLHTLPVSIFHHRAKSRGLNLK